MDISQNPFSTELRIFIKRIIFNNRCIIGELEILNSNNGVLYSCNTLENPIVGVEANRDLAVPEGFYKCEFHRNSRFTDGLHKIVNDDSIYPLNIYNDRVPLNRRILVHWGNFEKDTEGCILLGKAISGDESSITGSRKACEEFYRIIGQYSAEDLSVIIYK